MTKATRAILERLNDEIASLQPACDDLLPNLRQPFRAGHKQCNLKVRVMILDLLDKGGF